MMFPWPRGFFSVCGAACLIAIVPFRGGESERLAAVGSNCALAPPAFARVPPPSEGIELNADLIAELNAELARSASAGNRDLDAAPAATTDPAAPEPAQPAEPTAALAAVSSAG